MINDGIDVFELANTESQYDSDSFQSNEIEEGSIITGDQRHLNPVEQ